MPRILAWSLSALLVVAAAPAVAQTPAHSAEEVTVTNPHDGTTIVATVFKPGSAGPAHQVPVILDSHGWGGSRRTSLTDSTVQAFLNAGFGLVSFDQRGWGESSGQANVQDPTKETEDVKALIDHIATLDWVQHDRDASGAPIADDPVLGAIGGSYGGGYQTMTSLDEIADEGRTRLDALVPEITWYDLPESLAPQKVPRTAWNAVLYAAGARTLPRYVHEAFAWASVSGQWPDGTLLGRPAPGVVPDLDAEFHKHGPVYFAEQGIKLDIPIMIRQGASDNLFNLNQGLDIFHKALTDEARQNSYFVSFNGGHALPNVVPPGRPAAVEVGGGADACSGNWTATRIEFFRKALAGGSTEGVLPSQYNFTDLDNADCMRFDSFENETLRIDPLGAGSVISTAGAGAPMHFELARGPLKVTGVPQLEGLVTSAGLDNRAFFGLAIGTSPADAKVIQNNLMPLRVVGPSVDRPFSIELPGVSVQIPQGQSLFLTVSPFSDMYFGHGSRVPGALALSDLSLELPGPAAAAPTVEEPASSSLTLRREGRGSRSQLVAELTDAETGAPIAGAEIAFTAGGTSLGSSSTDDEGVAIMRLKGRYRSDDHTYGASFGGNDDYEGSSASTG
jgi:ABC-2 type transport system ATP-binding protein